MFQSLMQIGMAKLHLAIPSWIFQIPQIKLSQLFLFN